MGCGRVLMLTTTENGSAAATAPDEGRATALASTNGTYAPAKNRLRAAFAMPPERNGDAAHRDERPVLALFCHEEPDSAVGRFVAHIAGALAKRQTAVHLFSRKDFKLDGAGISVHV